MVTNSIFEFLRFVFIGSIGALSYLVFSNIYNFLGVSVLLSPLFAWVSGLVIVFYGHLRVTYRMADFDWKMVLRFFVMQIYNLIMSTVSTYLVVSVLGYSYFYGSIVALAVTVPVLFFLGKFWVYRY